MAELKVGDLTVGEHLKIRDTDFDADGARFVAAASATAETFPAST